MLALLLDLSLARTTVDEEHRALLRVGAGDGVDEVDDPLIDVAADDLVASAGDGDGQGQPDLAERDDDDAHQLAVASATGRTVSPLEAASRTASA